MEKRPKYIEGVGWRYETEHRQTRRMRKHDYHDVGSYLITVVVVDRIPVFGDVEGSLSKRCGEENYPYVSYSGLGRTVIEEEVGKIHRYYPMVDVWSLCIMPDHIHLIVRVKGEMPKGKHLGTVIGAFKGGVSRAWWNGDGVIDGLMPGERGLCKSQSVRGISRERLMSFEERRVSHKPLFEDDYNDKVLLRDGQLSNWKRYLKENPYRLLLRRTYPDLMERALSIKVNNAVYSAFGNLLLLKYPEKRQVFCHRKARYGQLTEKDKLDFRVTFNANPEYTTSIKYEETDAFLQEKTSLVNSAYEGTPLVTPGISPGEKDIKNTCIDEGLPLIHIQKEPITRFWKPERSRFYACVRGTMLILAPHEEFLNGNSNYDIFHDMNRLAKDICELDISSVDFKVSFR